MRIVIVLGCLAGLAGAQAADLTGVVEQASGSYCIVQGDTRVRLTLEPSTTVKVREGEEDRIGRPTELAPGQTVEVWLTEEPGPVDDGVTLRGTAARIRIVEIGVPARRQHLDRELADAMRRGLATEAQAETLRQLQETTAAAPLAPWLGLEGARLRATDALQYGQYLPEDPTEGLHVTPLPVGAAASPGEGAWIEVTLRAGEAEHACSALVSTGTTLSILRRGDLTELRPRLVGALETELGGRLVVFLVAELTLTFEVQAAAGVGQETVSVTGPFLVGDTSILGIDHLGPLDLQYRFHPVTGAIQIRRAPPPE
jgi:hypothetical protein